MYTYEVVTRDNSVYVVEADYFRVTTDDNSLTEACFYVSNTLEIPLTGVYRAPVVIEETLVAYAREPVLVRLDDDYEYKPRALCSP